MLYLCPIKALLNNLDIRLQRYCTLLGRRSALWHGDVKTRARREILREPPNCLLTTPESLEVMLVSSNVDAPRLFGQLQVIIIDEIHAFAGLKFSECLPRDVAREMLEIRLCDVSATSSILHRPVRFIYQ